MIGFILLGIAVIVALWAVGGYNYLVRLNGRAKEAWADIDVQLKRRYDLVPNLIEVVKGYAAHEKGVFEEVTKARASAVSAGATGAVAEKGKAEVALTGALRSLFAVSENYPELKANQNFLELSRELSDTEDKIQSARRFYNTNVRDLNIGIDTFPTNILAQAFSFTKMVLFELSDEKAREPVHVSL
ncbi:MAG: LemA family protein [Patescibacteria group bacterium]